MILYTQEVKNVNNTNNTNNFNKKHILIGIIGINSALGAFILFYLGYKAMNIKTTNNSTTRNQTNHINKNEVINNNSGNNNSEKMKDIEKNRENPEKNKEEERKFIVRKEDENHIATIMKEILDFIYNNITNDFYHYSEQMVDIYKNFVSTDENDYSILKDCIHKNIEKFTILKNKYVNDKRTFKILNDYIDILQAVFDSNFSLFDDYKNTQNKVIGKLVKETTEFIRDSELIQGFTWYESIKSYEKPKSRKDITEENIKILESSENGGIYIELLREALNGNVSFCEEFKKIHSKNKKNPNKVIENSKKNEKNNNQILSMEDKCDKLKDKKNIISFANDIKNDLQKLQKQNNINKNNNPHDYDVFESIINDIKAILPNNGYSILYFSILRIIKNLSTAKFNDNNITLHNIIKKYTIDKFNQMINDQFQKENP